MFGCLSVENRKNRYVVSIFAGRRFLESVLDLFRVALKPKTVIPGQSKKMIQLFF
jgi:hypothetical protein